MDHNPQQDNPPHHNPPHDGPPHHNPPHTEKATFRRMTVTLPPGMYERLVQESARRKIAGEPNQLLSAMLREAVTLYLERLNGCA